MDGLAALWGCDRTVPLAVPRLLFPRWLFPQNSWCLCCRHGKQLEGHAYQLEGGPYQVEAHPYQLEKGILIS